MEPIKTKPTMHSGDMIEIDESNLTEEEKEKLKVVMEKARVRTLDQGL